MSKIIKVFKTIRNHWKKSTVFAIGVCYGLDYAKSKYENMQMMRAYCEEAKTYGDVAVGNVEKIRHLTVILNPSAKNGKGLKLYEKYAMPLLHLAGLRISLIKTEYEGQAKHLMEIMDNTDAVLIAGGDGTVSEVVTGLCKREDSYSAIQRFPLGIIPIGKTNTVSKYLFWDHHINECRLLAETTMAVIKGTLKPVDVMSVTADDGKQVYALASLEWGRFRDSKVKVSQYWYFGFLKDKLAYLFAVMKSLPDPMKVNLTYTLPCEGCSKCYLNKGQLIRDPVEDNSRRRWWYAFRPKQPVQQSLPITKDFSKIENEQCGVKHERSINTVDFSIETINNRRNTVPTTENSLLIYIEPETMGRLAFIKRGWKIDQINYSETKNNSNEIDVIAAQDVRLDTKIEEGIESWYSIDSENFEAKSISVQLHPKQVNVYCIN